MTTILIVDDNAENCKFLNVLLSSAHYQLLQAEDGEQGLKIAQKEHPDLVITDILMPKMDGYEFVCCLRNDPHLANTKVIFYTAKYLENEARDLAKVCGVAHFIVKPSKPGDILKIVEKVLAQTVTIPPIQPFEDFYTKHIRLVTNKLYQEANKLDLLNKELEQRVTERTEQLESFSYSVSHDLRAPLRYIIHFSQLLLKSKMLQTDKEAHENVEKIIDATTKMENLIDDILEFSSVARYQLSTEPQDINLLVDDIIKELEPDLKNRNIRWEIDKIEPIHADKNLLRIALMNLILNAVKFTQPQAQAVIQIKSILHLKNEEGFFIRDNGVGFDMKYADKLFRVFNRLHSETEFEGTGIGLASVKKIMQRHGGRIWAQAEVGKGATFYLAFPQHKK